MVGNFFKGRNDFCGIKKIRHLTLCICICHYFYVAVLPNNPFAFGRLPKTMYFIEDPYQKQGIVYEVLSALIKYAFGSMDIHKIVAETIEGNDACVKLLEKLSLTREATLRKQNWDHDNWVDEYHYGLLREEVV